MPADRYRPGNAAGEKAILWAHTVADNSRRDLDGRQVAVEPEPWRRGMINIDLPWPLRCHVCRDRARASGEMTA